MRQEVLEQAKATGVTEWYKQARVASIPKVLEVFSSADASDESIFTALQVLANEATCPERRIRNCFHVPLIHALFELASHKEASIRASALSTLATFPRTIGGAAFLTAVAQPAEASDESASSDVALSDADVESDSECDTPIMRPGESPLTAVMVAAIVDSDPAVALAGVALQQSVGETDEGREFFKASGSPAPHALLKAAMSRVGQKRYIGATLTAITAMFNDDILTIDLLDEVPELLAAILGAAPSAETSEAVMLALTRALPVPVARLSLHEAGVTELLASAVINPQATLKERVTGSKALGLLMNCHEAKTCMASLLPDLCRTLTLRKSQGELTMVLGQAIRLAAEFPPNRMVVMDALKGAPELLRRCIN